MVRRTIAGRLVGAFAGTVWTVTAWVASAPPEPVAVRVIRWSALVHGTGRSVPPDTGWPASAGTGRPSTARSTASASRVSQLTGTEAWFPVHDTSAGASSAVMTGPAGGSSGTVRTSAECVAAA